MLKITEEARAVNVSTTRLDRVEVACARKRKRDYKNSPRQQMKTRRTLLLIDLLAPRRHWTKTTDIRDMLRERLGERICTRTVERDLFLLESLGMVDRRIAPDSELRLTEQWHLNLKRTESAQAAAIKLFPIPAPQVEAPTHFDGLEKILKAEEKQALGPTLNPNEKYRIVIITDEGVSIAHGAFSAEEAKNYVAGFDKTKGVAWIAQEEFVKEATPPTEPVQSEATWSVLRIDPEDGEVTRLDGTLTEEQVAVAWQEWNAKPRHGLMVPWPKDLPLPHLQIMAEPDGDEFTGRLPEDGLSLDEVEERYEEYLSFVVNSETGSLIPTDGIFSKEEAVSLFAQFAGIEHRAGQILWPKKLLLPRWLERRAQRAEVRQRDEWKLYFADLETKQVFAGEQALTRTEAFSYHRRYKAKHEQTICVPWPTWAPAPVITFAQAESE